MNKRRKHQIHTAELRVKFWLNAVLECKLYFDRKFLTDTDNLAIFSAGLLRAADHLHKAVTRRDQIKREEYKATSTRTKP